MAQTNYTAIKTMITNIKTLAISDGKIDAAELDQVLNGFADSASWEDTAIVMSSNTFNCATGRLQTRSIASNETLIITNAVAGKYYTIVKSGAGTLNLPSGSYSVSGPSVGAGLYAVTFLYTGTQYLFSFGNYVIVP
jgi:hypothetical protein